MSEGRKPLAGNDEWCTDYHCAGDCGMRGHGYQHQYRELEDDPEQQEWVISGLDDANDEPLTQ